MGLVERAGIYSHRINSLSLAVAPSAADIMTRWRSHLPPASHTRHTHRSRPGERRHGHITAGGLVESGSADCAPRGRTLGSNQSTKCNASFHQAASSVEWRAMTSTPALCATGCITAPEMRIAPRVFQLKADALCALQVMSRLPQRKASGSSQGALPQRRAGRALERHEGSRDGRWRRMLGYHVHGRR